MNSTGGARRTRFIPISYVISYLHNANLHTWLKICQIRRNPRFVYSGQAWVTCVNKIPEMSVSTMQKTCSKNDTIFKNHLKNYCLDQKGTMYFQTFSPMQRAFGAFGDRWLSWSSVALSVTNLSKQWVLRHNHHYPDYSHLWIMRAQWIHLQIGAQWRTQVGGGINSNLRFCMFFFLFLCCPDRKLELDICGMHHLWTVSFMVGFFHKKIPFYCSCLISSGVGVVGYFLTLWCNGQFKK